MTFAIYRYFMYTLKWLVKTLVEKQVSLGLQVARQSTARPWWRMERFCEAEPGDVEPLKASKREE